MGKPSFNFDGCLLIALLFLIIDSDFSNTYMYYKEGPSSVHFYSMLDYMVTMLSQLLLYCWCGSQLTKYLNLGIKSEELRECLYQCPWYEQDAKFKRSLIIAMERMKRPIIFKAGHYIPLSRPTFVSVLRSSYSYFAVLNQANNK